ncbi:MAG TPA: agmatine deiminase family protein, partial [Bryobacteraceae bacterium]|nr:agmatine deiminase family protein [Bryobacteraceae bacterium]
MSKTPLALGFRMPAEWEPHEATWIAWPHNREDWPGRFTPIPWVYGEIVRWLSRAEKVRILVPSRTVEAAARRVLKKCGADLSAVEFFAWPTDRSWTRDYCPLFLKHGSGEVALTDWKFNGWAKYDNWQRDNAVPARIARRLGLRSWSPGLVLEGGSIDVNGRGLLLTTEECLLSPVQARNPHLTRGEIERALADFLGAKSVIWLRNGIAGDDTHGHVDDLARFVDPQTVVIAAESDRSDPNYEPLRENLELLRKQPLRVVKLPMPAPV